MNNLGARNVIANALHLHRNTLIYRIKKIENQTGYDLSDPNSILEDSACASNKEIFGNKRCLFGASFISKQYVSITRKDSVFGNDSLNRINFVIFRILLRRII